MGEAVLILQLQDGSRETALMITYVKYERLVLVIRDIQTYIFRSFSSHVEMDHCRYGLQ